MSRPQEKGGSDLKLRRILGTASTIGLIATGMAVGAPAAHATVLSCGAVVTTSNTTIVLTADIGSAVAPCSTAFGVLLGGNNVVFDLAGHTVWGAGSIATPANNVGIYATSSEGGGTNITIKNGTVTGFNSGVYLEQTINNTVRSMSLHDNIGPDASGIFGEGLQVFSTGTGGHTITGNSVVHNGPFAGIDVYGPTNNNTVTGNSVVNNNIIDSGDHHGGGTLIMQDIGIWLINLDPSGTTTNNTVSSNSVVGNGLDGIQVANFTNGNFVRTNSVNNNGFGQPATNPFRDGDGIAIFGSSNTVQLNSVNGNGGNGIGVEGSGAVNGKSNTITTNVALFNGSAPKTQDFDLFDRNVGCDANVWLLNVRITRNQTCIN